MQASQLNLSLANIDRVYSGKTGCMCGCKGKYTTPAESTRSVNTIASKVFNSPHIKVDEAANCVYVYEGNRTRVVFLKSMAIVNSEA